MTVAISTDDAQSGWLKVHILGNAVAAGPLGEIAREAGAALLPSPGMDGRLHAADEVAGGELQNNRRAEYRTGRTKRRPSAVQKSMGGQHGTETTKDIIGFLASRRGGKAIRAFPGARRHLRKSQCHRR